MRQLLDPHRDDLVMKAVDMAKAGDTTALRLCLERLAPVARAEAPRAVVPGLAEAATLTDKAAAILAAAGRAQISPDTATMLLQAMAAACKVAEFEDFEKRIAALESAKGKR